MLPTGSQIREEVAATDVGRRILEIAARLVREGGRAVLVGGVVRDGLLGEAVKDLDVEVFGLTRERLEAVLGEFGEVITVGQAFGVWRVAGLDVDFSLPRRDNKVAPGHRGFEVECDPNLDFAEAARRRDVSVNSMGIDLATGELLDPHGGLRDLSVGLLRATDPSTFGEDPLRALRVAQFAARFDFAVDDDLYEICSGFDLGELPGERILEEFRKLLSKGRKPSLGFEFLRASDLLSQFPEIAALVGVVQDPEWHPEGDVYIHTLMALDRAVAFREAVGEHALAMMFGVLCHDFGKPATTQTVDGRIRSLGHEAAGLEPTRAFLDRLCASNELHGQVERLVADHLAPAVFFEQGATARAYRRLARKHGEVGLPLTVLEAVARADHFGRTTEDAVAGRFPGGDHFLEQAAALEVASEAPRDVVQGRHLIARGLEPSPEFGRILERCRDLQDETGLRDAEEILSRVLGD